MMNSGLRWVIALIGIVCCVVGVSAQELSESDKAILGAITIAVSTSRGPARDFRIRPDQRR